MRRKMPKQWPEAHGSIREGRHTLPAFSFSVAWRAASSQAAAARRPPRRSKASASVFCTLRCSRCRFAAAIGLMCGRICSDSTKATSTLRRASICSCNYSTVMPSICTRSKSTANRSGLGCGVVITCPPPFGAASQCRMSTVNGRWAAGPTLRTASVVSSRC